MEKKLLASVVFAGMLAAGASRAALSVSPAHAESTADSDTNAVQTYTGTIINMNGQRFILRDDDNNTWYHLDDQQKAAQFLGKKVVVSGKLDASTDFIHVQDIQVEVNKRTE